MLIYELEQHTKRKLIDLNMEKLKQQYMREQ